LWKSLDSSFPRVHRVLDELKECRAWERWPARKPAGSLEALCLLALGIDLPRLLGEVEKLTQKQKAQETGRTTQAADDPHSRPGNDGNRTAGAKKEKGHPRSRGSNKAETRVARLKRDHPEVAERLAAGEFRSVAAAERVSRGEEANPPRKVAPPLIQGKRAWTRMSEAERQEFLQWIGRLEKESS
jgi:hypothetical protein